ncbi:glycosyltransferase family 2 protein [Euzebya tangerina]|uniref:glycosyltransferase family 2 protein n=1 Tax=Euzebya tangerina TaxID=591198 RepID=UPI000E31B9E3|nr:glycosyltransferase [Euzebya tangerina]
MARLSVIVTSYNIEAYLEQCLESILAQTLEDLEIIVVDDGSSDDSPAIIRRFADRDDRVVPLLLEENSVGGVATAANAGLDIATAPYVGFADGDDVYDVRMFEQLLQAAEAEDADLAMCQYVLLDDSDGSIAQPADSRRWDDLARGTYALDVDRSKQILRFIAVPWRKIYRRSLLEENSIRFPVGDYFYEDNPFHWFSVLSANSIAVVPEVLCQHRVARVGQTMGTADERLFKIFLHHATILEWLQQRGLAEEYQTTLLAWAMSQMEWISRRTPEELHQRLYDVLRAVFAAHDDATAEHALVEGSKGAYARRLTSALMADDYAAFKAALGRDDANASLVDKALHHVRSAGVVETSRIAGRFAYYHGRRRGRRVMNAARRLLAGVRRGSSAGAVTRDDLMFGLMIVEQRLGSIEEELARQRRDTSGEGT